MKTLKFKQHLVFLILSGEKTSTWRLFDDKNLQVGDKIEFINKDALETFGYGKIIDVKEKKLGELKDSDFSGHEKFSSDKEMYQTYSKYYNREVTPDDIVKMIDFYFSKV